MFLCRLLEFVSQLVTCTAAIDRMDSIQSVITLLHSDDHRILLSSLLGPVVLALCLIQWRRLNPPKLDFPVVGNSAESDFRAALEEGARRVCIYVS